MSTNAKPIKRPTLTEAIANGPTREEAQDVKLRDLLDDAFVPQERGPVYPRFDSRALDEVGAAQKLVERAIRADVETLTTHGTGHANLKAIERYLNRATRALRRIDDARRAMQDAADSSGL